jgi:aspartate racemase
MKTLGIIGGIGPESTIDYYRSIIVAYRDQTKDRSCPSILINSIDLQKMLDFVAADQLPELSEYLSGEMARLAKAGANIGLLAANTAHVVFEEVSRLLATSRTSWATIG